MVEDQVFNEPPQLPPLPGGGEDMGGFSGLQHYWHMVRSRLWILVVVPALCLGVAIFRQKSVVPVYRAHCRLLVEAGDTRLLRVDGVYDPTASGMDSFIKTQLELMQTGDMLEQAFADIGAKRMIATRLDVARRLGCLLAAADHSRLAFAGVSITSRVAKGLSDITAATLARLIMPQEADKAMDTPTHNPALGDNTENLHDALLRRDTTHRQARAS